MLGKIAQQKPVSTLHSSECFDPTDLLPFNYAYTVRLTVWGAREESLKPPPISACLQGSLMFPLRCSQTKAGAITTLGAGNQTTTSWLP